MRTPSICGSRHILPRALRHSLVVPTLNRHAATAARPPTETQRESLAFPVVEKCPPATCSCASVPSDLEIDHAATMRGAMPLYSHHITINTGRDDWSSRIEDENEGNNLAKHVRKLIGPGGDMYNPRRNILITNSSARENRADHCSISVFPDCYDLEIRLGELAETLKVTLGDLYDVKVKPLRYHKAPTILICGHNSRDNRCGVLGPLLRSQFREQLAKMNSQSDAGQDQRGNTQLHLISHIGGHKWAGNVIIYLPPDHHLSDGTVSPLAAKGIWYGRVEPRHVEGILNETIQKGRVVEELLRGVHGG